ncbi:MAG: BREX system Lon protease-like protein BrxL [Eubacteriales bacterium]|nr:BREX system Lon protease-like protein BrxL [Eubacteriales bacterium]MDZ7610807.1 BREX system Lon protease-like protein BrxL [Eubacteriales bacterium]
MYDITKLREYFPTTTVYKDPSIMAMFKNAKIPAFLRDWILKRKAGSDGRISDTDALSTYIGTIIPRREDKGRLEDEARSNGETRQFLTRVEVSFNSKANYYTFEIPALGFAHNQTIVEDYVWDRIKDELIGEAGGWGLVKLGYMPPEGNKKNGCFTLLDYKNFCPYEVNLDAYREARTHFTTEEWMDIILGAIDYNPDGYATRVLFDTEIWEAKHTMLTRLLPFVEPRVNLIELAPQQTGKSYIFGKIGKYGYIAGGGSLSRAKLFYDIASKRFGIVSSNDFVAVDEIKSIKFSDNKEMQGILKGYMEDGYVNVGGVKVEGDAGIILLGNIDVNDMDGSKDMFRELPEVFRDAALIERVNGFILGRKIPSLTNAMIINDWALNTEYFTEIMHLLRAPAETLRYLGLVEQLVWTKHDVDKREKDSVFRLCTAYLKLFFPHADGELIKDSQFRSDFVKYCLQPAKRMRETVLMQMKIIDPSQFSKRFMSTYKLREDDV